MAFTPLDKRDAYFVKNYTDITIIGKTPSEKNVSYKRNTGLTTKKGVKKGARIVLNKIHYYHLRSNIALGDSILI